MFAAIPSLSFACLVASAVICRAGELPKISAAATDIGHRPTLVGEFDRVIPFVIDGSGSKTFFVLTNLDAKTVYFDLFFNSGSGAPMQLPISGVGSTARLFGTIPVNQSIVFQTDGTADSVSTGYVSLFTIDRPANDPNSRLAKARIGGMAVVRGGIAGRPPFEATIPIVPSYETHFVLPFDNRGGVQAALIVLNNSARPSPISVIVRDGAGNVVARDSLSLDSGQSAFGVLTDLYPQTAEQSGIVQVSTTAIGLSGLGLRFDSTGAFTAIQTLSSDVDPSAPALPSPAPSTLPGISSSCTALQGTLLFANDGQYLGKITSNTTDPESVGNTFGKYGSEFSSVSIFNQFGQYGGQFAALSPFNAFTNVPPLIYVNERAAAYLTVNITKTPRVDTLTIYPCIGRR